MKIGKLFSSVQVESKIEVLICDWIIYWPN